MGKIKNNPVESRNSWMCELRQMSILYLIIGQLQKLGKKIDMRKGQVKQWKNGVRERIEKKLKNTLCKIGSVL